MFDTVKALRKGLEEAVDRLDTDGLDGPRAARLLDEFVAIERLGANAKTLVAQRLDETRGWRGEGDRSFAHYMARKAGTSVAQATETVKTAQRIDPWGATADAMKSGDVSAQQVSAITEACETDPNAERDLLATAANDSVEGLRAESRRVKAAARIDELAHDEVIRRSRYLRAWTDREGAGRGEWKVPPEDQARIVTRLNAELDAVIDEARKAGATDERREARMADALVRLADSGDSAGDGRSKVAIHLRVDHSAFERGDTEPGEICEIEGIGPVPVATARNLSTDALVYVLATKGRDITHYAERGRYIPDKLRLALEARDQVCVALGCNVRDGLEIHHIDPVDNNGETSLENCCRLCRWHHYLCTHQRWRVEPTPEGWRVTPPDNRAPPTDRDPPDLRLAV